MGVHGLWELLSPVGHRVSNEHVRNKVLAVDISIWLTQFVKAMRDVEGAQVRNAHLLGVFRRCIKLLYLSVRPVLIFDGTTPALKRKTLAGRRAMRDRHEAKLRRLAERMLVNRMKMSVLGAAIRTKRKGSRGKAIGTSANAKHLVAAAADVRQPQETAADAGQKVRRNRKAQEKPEEEEEDCVQPVHAPGAVNIGTPNEDTTIPPEVARMQEEEDAIFAADLADEEEAMTREEDAAPIDMPYDVDDIDDGALQDLPPTMQSEIFKQIKLNQRARHRERMLLQRNDPAQFSRAQIEGFLQNTALNRKIHTARNALNHKSGASQRIASDSKRQYVLEEKNGNSLNGEDAYGSDGSSDDDILATGRDPAGGNVALAKTDILAQLRAKRDIGLGVSSALQEERNQIKRENEQKRSGVGWASRVLEGKGGLFLGGRSALGISSREATTVVSESDGESWEDAGCFDGARANDTRGTGAASNEADEDDSDEWEDGDANVLPHDSEKAPDFGCVVNRGKAREGNGVSMMQSLRRGNTQPQLANANTNKGAKDKKEKNTSQGKSGTGFPDVNDFLNADGDEKPEFSSQRHRRGLLDLDTVKDGDSEIVEERIIQESPLTKSNDSWGLKDEKEKTSSLEKCEIQPRDNGEISEQEKVEKPVISGQRRRRGLLDLDASYDEDSETMQESVVEGSPYTDKNTCVDPTEVLSKEHVALEGVGNSESVGELPGSIKLSSEQLSKKLSPAMEVDVGSVKGNTIHEMQAVLPNKLQSCDNPVSKMPQGPSHSDPSISFTKRLSSTMEREEGAKVNKASKRVTFCDTDVSGQLQADVESTEKFESTPDVNTARRDMRSVRDTHNKHEKITRKRRKGDDEEHEDVQLAIALSLQENESQGPRMTREQTAESIEQRASHVSLQRREEKGVYDTEQSESSQGALLRKSLDAGEATEKKSSDATQIEAKSKSREDRNLGGLEKIRDEEHAVQNDGRESDEPVDEMATVHGDEAMRFEATEMSAERMQELRDELEVEERELKRQKSSHQGGAESVSEEMYGEARDLLKLFGIPYLEAPEEAEAQCAFLNKERVVDGVITEDSDAFLFGAQTVYRKLFSEGQFAEAYEANHIRSKLGLDRNLLIRLAYLLGSDYTIGVRGVGVVNSMEVLEAFPGEKGLEEFRDWTKKVTVFDEQPEEEVMTGTSPEAIRRRFCWKHRNMKRNWEVRPEFPNKAVAEAYLRPRIDPSTERFTWGRVDFAGLGKFCWEKFGWEEDRFEVAVGALRQKLKDDRKERGQTRIDEFFKPHRFAKIRSVRLQTAVTGMVGAEAADLMADTLGRPKVKRRKTAAVSHVAVDSDEETEMMAAVEQAERKLRESNRAGR